MSSIDCIDEILINAPIEKVFDTVLDYPNWKQWIPIYKCYLQNSDSVKEGSEIRHQYGYKPFIISDFVRRIDKVDTNKRLSESYISGGLLGKGTWYFTESNGKTKAAYHCQVTANNLFNNLTFKFLGSKAHQNVYEPLLIKLKNHCELQQ